jgi:hypothetical protein
MVFLYTWYYIYYNDKDSQKRSDYHDKSGIF